MYGHQPATDAVVCAKRVTDGYKLDAISTVLHARAGTALAL